MSRVGRFAIAMGIITIGLIALTAATWHDSEHLRPVLTVATATTTVLTILPPIAQYAIREELRRDRNARLRDAAAQYITAATRQQELPDH